MGEDSLHVREVDVYNLASTCWTFKHWWNDPFETWLEEQIIQYFQTRVFEYHA